MRLNLKYSFIGVSLVATLILSGCNSDSSSTTETQASTSVTGQLTDGYVANASYVCQDGSSGTTDINGTFSCNTLPITFKLGGLTLGSLTTLPNDKHVFPQDILGKDRNATDDVEVIAMARFLQSCDNDGDLDNGIDINTTIIGLLSSENKPFASADIDSYATLVHVTLKDENASREHLNQSLYFIQNKYPANYISDLKAKTDLDNIALPQYVKDAILTPASTLSDELKMALEHMGDEERLAYNIYLSFYDLYKTNQFRNIPNNSEIKHLQAVQVLIQKYDITSTELYDNNISDLVSGTYKTEAIQAIFDDLNASGSASMQGAYEAGCKIEVTDVNDLNTYIGYAEDANASDVKAVFEFLRAGSYNHYKAFDMGMKNFVGISTGCCSLGEAYCKDYTSTSGSGMGSGNGM